MPDDPETLLADAVRLKVFVVLRHTRDQARLKEMLPAHLRWMAEQERTGRIFLSGPITSGGGGTRPDGLTMVRAPDAGAAEALIQDDPVIASGIVDAEICEWQVNEGRLQVTLSLSESSFEFS